MTKTESHGPPSVSTPQDVRRQAARIRKELGRALRAMSSRTGAAGRAQDRIDAVGQQARRAAGRLRDATGHGEHLGVGRSRDSAGWKAVRAAAAARINRTAVIATAGVLAGVLLLRRTRRAHRGAVTATLHEVGAGAPGIRERQSMKADVLG